MNKTIYLGLAIIVLILTAIGVYSFNSYKTTITVSNLGGSSINGKYELIVKIYVNYGPFGGTHPLSSADVWLYLNGKYYNQSLTNSQGEVIFYVPPGNYTVFFTVFHITKNIVVNSNTEVVLNYAYLKSS
ncbi:hypothetical protein SJAV_24850 [Sulfurisphaera javensis]|uniref:Carboxypeptidase regulatory-like domain-containing protein n=1 Tax=Sulfurisphaera javensis TaxID=2049879 RepID=A0AAT9GUQ2_9CREN